MYPPATDGTVRLWDLASGDCRQTLSGHSEGVLFVAYSPGGNQIATCSADKTLRLWSVDTGVCSNSLNGHSNKVRSAVYSPQGHQLASASDDTTVRIWDEDTGTCSMVLTAHSRGVTRVRYSPESDLLASGSLDKTVRLWIVASGLCRAVVRNFQDGIFDTTWSSTPEGNNLVTGCKDGSVFIWQVIEEGDLCRMSLRWGFTNDTLNVSGAVIQGVHGLSQSNARLLERRGASGGSVDLLHETSKKLISLVRRSDRTIARSLPQSKHSDISPDDNSK